MDDSLRALRSLSLIARRVRGGGRLSEALRKAYAARGGYTVIDDFDGDLKFGLRLSDHIGSQIFWHGLYSRDVLAVAAKCLKPSQIVVDAGANIGEFSVFAAKRVPQGCVHAFEPFSGVREDLENNVALNGFSNLRVHPIALGSRSERVPIFAANAIASDGAVNQGMNTLFKADGFAPVEMISIEVLDEWADRNDVPKIDFVKIDVEGAEKSVLEGGRGIIRRSKPLMIIECNPVTSQRAGYEASELLDCVRSLGYSIRNIGHSGQTSGLEPGDPASRDVLCVPS